MKYIVLEKSHVKGHYATIKGKRVWVKEYQRAGEAKGIVSNSGILKSIKNLLDKIRGLKKQGQFTKEQKVYVQKKLAELEPKIKHFKTQKERVAVFNALKEVRKELGQKVTRAERHEPLKAPAINRALLTKDGKILSEETRKGLDKLGYSTADVKKMSEHEAKAIYWNEIEKEETGKVGKP